jgi:hypothetical protein
MICQSLCRPPLAAIPVATCDVGADPCTGFVGSLVLGQVPSESKPLSSFKPVGAMIKVMHVCHIAALNRELGSNASALEWRTMPFTDA